MAAAVYDTPEALAKLSEMDAEFAELLATTPQPPHLDFTHPVVLAIRQNQLAAAEKARTEALAKGESAEQTLTIPMRDGYESEIRIHRPPISTSPSPLIILFHGGGFIFGNNAQPAPTARRLASLYNATVICPAYRLAPEHPWPAAHEDAWDSLVWIVEHASSSSSSSSSPSPSSPPCLSNVSLETGFVLAGSSAGGNIAAVLVGKYLSHPPAIPNSALPPALTGLWIDSSMLFHSLPYVPLPYRDLHLSHEQNADAPGLLSKQAVGYIREAVRGDGGGLDFSPVNSTWFTSKFGCERDQAGEGMGGRTWPKTFIQVAGMDPFRDDGIVFARMLGDAGTEVELKVYGGVPHGFASLWPGLRVAERARREGVLGVGWLLGREEEKRV